jgi:predicted kinase
MDATRVAILPDAPHSRADREVALRAMLWAARLLLEREISVILDAQYRRSGDRERVYELAAGFAVPVHLIETSVSAGEAVRWFRERGPDPVRRDLTEEAVRAGASEFPFTRGGLFLRTDVLPMDECLRRIEEFLEH